MSCHVMCTVLCCAGHWNYGRIAIVVLFMFYKDILYNFTQTWWSAFTPFSGQKFFVELANMAINIVRPHAAMLSSQFSIDNVCGAVAFTMQLYVGLPVLVVGVLDRDTSIDNCLLFPALYLDGPRRQYINRRQFVYVE
jgi:hypothetical protein